MTHAVCVSKYLSRVMDSDDCSLTSKCNSMYPHTSTLDQCFTSSYAIRRELSAWGKSRKFENEMLKTF
ncbi:hypothetical protein HKD37_05G012154 [Glycine soja]